MQWINGELVESTRPVRHTPVFDRLVRLEQAAIEVKAADAVVTLVLAEMRDVEAGPWSMDGIRRSNVLGRWYDEAWAAYRHAQAGLLAAALA